MKEERKGRRKEKQKGHPLLTKEKCGGISGMWNPGEP